MEFKSTIKVYLDDNLNVLKSLDSNSVDMIYIDPPFNTGIKQIRNRFHTENGIKISENTYGYEDNFNDFIGFLRPRMEEAYRILKDNGSFFFHLDYREIHYCKVMLDQIFGRNCFINEIIWAYDYGARSKSKWSTKHDNILWYSKTPDNYTFNYDEMDRIPYMAPGLVGPEKAARGKTPTDVWWHTIVSPNSKEKTGYATQKPLGIIKRIVKIHSHPDDTVMDFFAGSGTLGEAAAMLGRKCILIDQNPEAIAVMKRRFCNYNVEWINCDSVQEAGEAILFDDPDFHFDEPEGFTQPLTPVSGTTKQNKMLDKENKSPKRRGRPPKKNTIQKSLIATSVSNDNSSVEQASKSGETLFIENNITNEHTVYESQLVQKKSEYRVLTQQQGTLI